jgi:hypothetical protein
LKTLEERLAQIEARLARIEQLLPAMSAARLAEASLPADVPAAASPASVQDAAAAPAAMRRAIDPHYGAAAASRHEMSTLSVTQILGSTGATALVLAAAYLIRRALDAGWLTPERQLGLAVLSGLGLIGAGLKLRAADKQYASLLPAGGPGGAVPVDLRRASLLSLHRRAVRGERGDCHLPGRAVAGASSRRHASRSPSVPATSCSENSRCSSSPPRQQRSCCSTSRMRRRWYASACLLCLA